MDDFATRKCICRIVCMTLRMSIANEVLVNGMHSPMMKRSRRLNSIVDLSSADFIQEVTNVDVPELGEIQVKVVKGDFSAVPLVCQQFIARYVSLDPLLKGLKWEWDNDNGSCKKWNLIALPLLL